MGIYEATYKVAIDTGSGTKGYTSLSSALSDLQDGDSLLTGHQVISEDVTLDTGFAFDFSGGYNEAFGTVIGATLIQGSVTLQNAAVTMSGIAIGAVL